MLHSMLKTTILLSRRVYVTVYNHHTVQGICSSSKNTNFDGTPATRFKLSATMINWVHWVQRNHISLNSQADLNEVNPLENVPRLLSWLYLQRPFRVIYANFRKAPQKLLRLKQLFKPLEFLAPALDYIKCQNKQCGLELAVCVLSFSPLRFTRLRKTGMLQPTHSCHAPFTAFACGESTKVATRWHRRVRIRGEKRKEFAELPCSPQDGVS